MRRLPQGKKPLQLTKNRRNERPVAIFFLVRIILNNCLYILGRTIIKRAAISTRI